MVRRVLLTARRLVGKGETEPAQPFVAVDPAIAILVCLDELLAQSVGAGRGGGKLLLTKSVRAWRREVEALLRAAPRFLGRSLSHDERSSSASVTAAIRPALTPIIIDVRTGTPGRMTTSARFESDFQA